MRPAVAEPYKVVQKPHRYSVEEYFELREKSKERLEFHNGQIRAMASGTASHSRIKTDTTALLSNASRTTDCEVMDSDMAIYSPSFNSFLLPDMSVVCGTPQFGDENETRLLNASLFIEVLSKSTEAYDRGEKFMKYRSIPSFREYVLINSQRLYVESWYKKDDKIWHMDSAWKLEDSIHIWTLDIDLPLAEIYRRVEFPSSDESA